VRHTCFLILPIDAAARIFPTYWDLAAVHDDGSLATTHKSIASGWPAKLMSDTVYIIDLTPSEQSRIADALRNEPVTIETYDSADQFLNQVALIPSGCILVPCNLSGMGVRALIIEILDRDLPLPIVVLGRESNLATAVELVRAGATDFLEEPFSDRQLRLAVQRALGTNERASP
jgi:FixJ family two-component response regulator